MKFIRIENELINVNFLRRMYIDRAGAGYAVKLEFTFRKEPIVVLSTPHKTKAITCLNIIIAGLREEFITEVILYDYDGDVNPMHLF